MGPLQRAGAIDLAADSVTREPLDEARFLAFYAATSPRLRSWLSRVTGNQAEAEDLMQEAYLRLIQHGIDTSDSPRATGWIYRTAIRLFYDQVRRRKRERPLEDGTAVGVAEVRGDVARLFENLPARERALLWLAYVEGCGHREIGERMGMAALSVRVLLYRARRRFESILREGGYSGSETG